MKALILTEHPVYSKRTKIILDKLIEAGYDVEQKVFSENEPFTGCLFDFVVVDELSKSSGDWFGVITEITEHCTPRDEKAVILGKKYPLQLDAQGSVYFTDEDGEKNYGCDDAEDSVYKFYRI